MAWNSAVLASIKSRADTLRIDASDLRQRLLLLHVRPNFETLAEESMDRAETELQSALETLRRVRSEFKALPADVRHLQEAE